MQKSNSWKRISILYLKPNSRYPTVWLIRDFVDSRFGAEAQAQNAKAAKAMKEIEQLKESLGKGSTSHFESELIPDGFADNLKRETGTYAKRYAGAKII